MSDQLRTMNNNETLIQVTFDTMYGSDCVTYSHHFAHIQLSAH